MFPGRFSQWHVDAVAEDQDSAIEGEHDLGTGSVLLWLWVAVEGVGGLVVRLGWLTAHGFSPSGNKFPYDFLRASSMASAIR